MSCQRSRTDDDLRVLSLHQMHLTEREPEPAITVSVQVLAESLDCPAASVTLIDDDREIFYAAVGIERCNSPREQAFCDYTIRSDEIMIVEDARLDERFADNPQVVDRGVRFYAGIALHALDGRRIGALSVRDYQPRALSETERRTLWRMGQIVESQLAWCADRWRRIQMQLMLDGVMKSSHDAVLLLETVCDPNGKIADFRICSASSAAEQIFGSQPDQLRDQSLLTVLGECMQAENFQRLVQAATTGQPDQFDCQCCCRVAGAAGGGEWHRISVSRWRNGLAMTLHDITEHKLTERQLHDLFEMAADLLCIFDEQGRIVRTNRSMERMAGVEAGRLVGRRMIDFIDERDRPRMTRLLSQLAEGRPIRQFESRMIDPQGRVHWLQWRARPVIESKMNFMVGYDVTETRQARRMLRDSECLARGVIDTLDEAIAIIDADGLILNVNQTWKQWATECGDGRGGSRRIGEGVNYLTICRQAAESGDTQAIETLRGIERVLAGECEGFEQVHSIQAADGPRWFETSVRRFELHRRIFAVIAHHDITRKKQAEQAGCCGQARQPDAESSGDGPDSRRYHGCVMVADGSADRRLIQFFLERRGLNVKTSSEGEQAEQSILHAWREGEPYAMVLMDLRMPGGDCLAVVRRLRRAGYSGVIIALTEHLVPADREKCLSAGCNDYLPKPISRSQLEQVLAHWISPADQAAA